jgi:hypothetical protein
MLLKSPTWSFQSTTKPAVRKHHCSFFSSWALLWLLQKSFECRDEMEMESEEGIVRHEEN